MSEVLQLGPSSAGVWKVAGHISFSLVVSWVIGPYFFFIPLGLGVPISECL